MDDSENNSETINALIDGAYVGRIDRRTFMRGLIVAGVSAATARDMADHAAYAQANQTAQLANLKSEYDYMIVGAGSAGCVMAHRLSQDGRVSVLVIEGGGTNLDQEKIINPMLYVTNFGTDTDWGNKTIPQANLMNRPSSPRSARSSAADRASTPPSGSKATKPTTTPGRRWPGRTGALPRSSKA